MKAIIIPSASKLSMAIITIKRRCLRSPAAIGGGLNLNSEYRSKAMTFNKAAKCFLQCRC
jgi:hypothetical protein